jgi:glycosyltransferase involved in cell wall biosynthesis
MILEGTYPYVTGGVSSWVHNLIGALPRVRFSLLTILPTHDLYREYKYEVPENVVSISEIYIHDYDLVGRRGRGNRRSDPAFEMLSKFYREIQNRDHSRLPEVYDKVVNPETRLISPGDLFFDKRTWDLLVELYEESDLDQSFIDFFWTWRYSHLPLFRLADARIPEAKVYHTISTGYAGLVAAIAKIKTGSPVILTEHGIYSNERRIEIEQAKWIYERKVDRTVISDTVSPFKQIWIEMFDHLSRITYAYSDQIVTLFENNRKLQVTSGAEPGRTRVIPNGINLGVFSGYREPKAAGETFQVGFVGRVVPIKDVKTFIRACRIVHGALPNTHFPIMGPTEEDEDYFEECKGMVEMLGLQECVEFTGRVDVRKAYPEMDVVVLTSVSEAQPLVILEANTCGVPSIATDVGACSELLNGRTADDIALGPGGLVTPIADPQATAEAILKILTEPGLIEKMGKSGTERVKRYYSEQDLNFAYLELYRQFIQKSQDNRRDTGAN